MTTPFINDMFALVFEAFSNLYPDKRCKCQWVSDLGKNDQGEELLGLTTFYDDGDIDVEISGKLTVVDAIEILAHELAHVAVGQDKGHGPEWEEAFDLIYNEYNRLGNLRFKPATESIETACG